MSTRIGFFIFIGSVLGAIIGNWLPFASSLEAAAGGLIGVGLAMLIDKKNASKD